uniref:Uncharacterized protein n=1 Tax=Rhizophora mucronata TaxID=61149 RepID=A0A2P2QXY9_RHIMU
MSLLLAFRIILVSVCCSSGGCLIEQLFNISFISVLATFSIWG